MSIKIKNKKKWETVVHFFTWNSKEDKSSMYVHIIKYRFQGLCKNNFENNLIEIDQPRNKEKKFDEPEIGTVLGEKYHPPKNSKWIKR